MLDTQKLKVNKQFILVNIYKELQEKKKEELPSGIKLHPNFLYHRYNLQWGIVQQIGSKAADNYPEAEVGDLCLFHHMVEDEAWRLIEIDENKNELRIIDASDNENNNEIFGFVKENGDLIPCQQYIFFNPNLTKIVKKDASLLLAETDKSVWEDDSYLRRKLEDIKTNKEQLSQSLVGINPNITREIDKLDEIKRKLESFDRESEMITKFLNKTQLVISDILHIHPSTAKELNCNVLQKIVLDKSLLYALDFNGHYYFIMNKLFVYGIMN